MKKMDFKKMEMFKAGDCSSAAAAATILVLAGAVVTGPVGWLALTVGGAAGLAAGANVGVQCFT